MEADGFKRLVESILPPPPVETMAIASVLPGEISSLEPPTAVPESTESQVTPVEQGGETGPQPLLISRPEEQPTDTAEPEIDLTPAILDIEEVERLFIEQLASLIPTPRAAKRFINIYRLIRATVPPADLPAFVGDEQNPGEHRAVMVLLAALTGYPRQSPYVFRKLRRLLPSSSWQAALDTFTPRYIPDTDPPQYQNRVVPTMDAGEVTQWQRLARALTSITGLPDKIEPYARWIPTVARFSFRGGKITDYEVVPQLED